jgi:general secretion pathway protein H
MRYEERGTRNEGKGTRLYNPRTSILAPRTCRSGFTLIELMVVIAILSIVVLVVLPRLPSTEAGKLRSSARSLASTIRFLGDRAVTAKSIYRLHLNMNDSTVAVKKFTAAGEETTPDDPFLGKRFIDEGITIEDVTMPRLGKTSDGEVIVTFGLGGLEEFMIVHLKDAKDGHFTVIAYPNSGKVKVEDGYQEVEL